MRSQQRLIHTQSLMLKVYTLLKHYVLVIIRHNGNTQRAQTTELEMKQRKHKLRIPHMHNNTIQSKRYKTKK